MKDRYTYMKKDEKINFISQFNSKTIKMDLEKKYVFCCDYCNLYISNCKGNKLIKLHLFYITIN